MAFTRDLGIQFPSDATQASPSSTLAARRGYRYITRGSRYGGQLGKLSGFEYPLGITFFKNLLPRSDLGAPEPVSYARFIDLRKTKIVDSVKELIFGTQFRASIDTHLSIDDTEGFNTEVGLDSKTFPAKLLGGGGFIGDVFYSPWHEVVWDDVIGSWTQKDGGYNSTDSPGTTGRAFHRSSSGVETHSAIDIVDMTLYRTVNGKYRAAFGDTASARQIFLAEITAVDNSGPMPLYTARGIPQEIFGTIQVVNQAPLNRLIVPIQVVPANVDDKCIIFIEPVNIRRLWIFTETVGTVNCPSQQAFKGPIDDPGARISNVNYVNNDPSAVGAIGQAI